jgi:beta-glucosidase
LLKALKKTGKPIIYVNFSGSAIALNWEKDNVSAIIQAFYPGEATGIALTNLLFGDFNPSGRLPVTFYKTVNDLPDFKDYNMNGRTYRYFKGEPLWGFGYGLSYTRYTYSNPVIPAESKAGEEIKISVDVTNSGKMDGEEVVQVYITDLEASVPIPIRSLYSFKRVSLKAGETRKVEFTLKPESFSIINQDYIQTVEPGKFSISIGGQQPDSNSEGPYVTKEIEITGPSFVVL